MTDLERADNEREHAAYKREQEALALARAISNFVNHGGDTQVLVEELLRDHRTLQQSLMNRVVLPYLRGMAQNSHDLRNQESVEIAQRIVAVVGDARLSYI